MLVNVPPGSVTAVLAVWQYRMNSTNETKAKIKSRVMITFAHSPTNTAFLKQITALLYVCEWRSGNVTY